MRPHTEIAHHSLHVQAFDSDDAVLRGVRMGGLEVELSPLPTDGEMQPRHGLGSLSVATATRGAPRQDTVLPCQGGQRAKGAWVFAPLARRCQSARLSVLRLADDERATVCVKDRDTCKDVRVAPTVRRWMRKRGKPKHPARA